MTTTRRAPDLDSLYCINADGSRRRILTADVRGRYQTIKKWIWAALILIYLVLPWITINGFPAVRIDLPARQFFLFGGTFNAQDFYLMFFVLTGIGFSLIVISALYGRIWCGYACPQTVFLEGVYRRIERWIDGSAAQQERLAKEPMRSRKLSRRLLKWGIYLGISSFLAHSFLAYFLGVDEVFRAMVSPPSEHPAAFVFVIVFTIVCYGNFTWFREQLCIVICPYGRLQGVLYDQDTVQVGYDKNRGEPRGHHREEQRGDCIDCFRCVAVCPTGIDIRNGTQLECIGCANCIDACDEVMEKTGRPQGLVRYDSQRGLEEGKHRFWRPRVALYAVLMLAGIGMLSFAASGRTPFEAKVLRLPGQAYSIDEDGVITNPYTLHLTNKQGDRQRFEVVATPIPGAEIAMPVDTVELESFQDTKLPVFVRIPRDRWADAPDSLEIAVSAPVGNTVITAPLLGPRKP